MAEQNQFLHGSDWNKLAKRIDAVHLNMPNIMSHQPPPPPPGLETQLQTPPPPGTVQIEPRAPIISTKKQPQQQQVIQPQQYFQTPLVQQPTMTLRHQQQQPIFYQQPYFRTLIPEQLPQQQANFHQHIIEAQHPQQPFFQPTHMIPTYSPYQPSQMTAPIPNAVIMSLTEEIRELRNQLSTERSNGRGQRRTRGQQGPSNRGSNRGHVRRSYSGIRRGQRGGYNGTVQRRSGQYRGGHTHNGPAFYFN